MVYKESAHPNLSIQFSGLDALIPQHASHHEECLSPTIVYLTLRDGNARMLGNDQVAVHHRGMHVTLEVIATGLRRSGERDARAGVGTGDDRGFRQC